jgi:hypothetical protein
MNNYLHSQDFSSLDHYLHHKKDKTVCMYSQVFGNNIMVIVMNNIWYN